MPADPIRPPAPTPIDLGAGINNSLDVFGNQSTIDRTLATDAAYQTGLGQNQAGASNSIMFGQGSQFDARSAMASVTPEVAAQLQAAHQGDPRPFDEWLGAWAEAGAQTGDPSAIAMLQGNQQFDPNSTVGQSIEAGRAVTQAGNEANTSARRSAVDDLITMGPQLNDANRAANAERTAALDSATGLGGRSDYYNGVGNAIDGAGQYGDVGFNAAQGPAGVNAGQVGTGALGNNLYNQALGQGNLGGVGQTLQGRAQGFANSTGQMSDDELRSSDQSIREGYAARGTAMGAGAITAESMGRLTNQRGRMMQDLGMADALNQSNLAETQQNRNFQQGVQGNDVARQQQNAGLALTGDMSNQGVAAQYGLTNQAQQQNLNLANRDFAQGQDQQNINNQALYGQLLQGQGQADRSYAGQLVGMQQAASIDPWSALTGVNSNAGAGGFGVGQQGFANAGSSGPENFDPSAGVNLDMVNSTNLANYNNNIYAADAGLAGARAQASAAKQAGLMSGIGSFLGCWVAREVYGAWNPKWMDFRYWMLNVGPKWFRKLYLKHGEKFAVFVADKPVLKYFIRKWMDSRIKTLENQCQHSVVT